MRSRSAAPSSSEFELYQRMSRKQKIIAKISVFSMML